MARKQVINENLKSRIHNNQKKMDGHGIAVLDIQC